MAEKLFLVNLLTFFGARLLPAVFLLFALSSSSLFSSRLLLFFRARIFWEADFYGFSYLNGKPVASLRFLRRLSSGSAIFSGIFW